MKFENQFALVPPADRLRTTVEIPLRVDARIKAIEPKTGVLQTTISILVTKLIDELNKSNIQPGERYDYQYALAECRLVLPDKYYSDAKSHIEQRSSVVKPATGTKRDRTLKTVSGNV
jgi:NH3-dependent NAD+ synthetase